MAEEIIPERAEELSSAEENNIEAETAQEINEVAALNERIAQLEAHIMAITNRLDTLEITTDTIAEDIAEEPEVIIEEIEEPNDRRTDTSERTDDNRTETRERPTAQIKPKREHPYFRKLWGS